MGFGYGGDGAEPRGNVSCGGAAPFVLGDVVFTVDSGGDWGIVGEEDCVTVWEGDFGLVSGD